MLKRFIAFTLLSMLISTNLLAKNKSGPETGGGGDPLEIEAVKFTDMEALEKAILYVSSSLSKAQLSSDFKLDIINEMNALKSEDKFRLLPAIIILAPGTGPSGYAVPENLNLFISLGGMTKFEKGSNIYLSNRVLTYSTVEMATVVLHETLHHLLNIGLSEDEAFVTKAAKAIIKNEDLSFIQKAILLRGNFNSTSIPLNAFLDSSNMREVAMSCVKIGWKDQMSPAWKPFEKLLEDKILYNLPPNLIESSFYSVSDKLSASIRAVKPNGLNSTENAICSFRIIKAIEEFAKKVKPEYSGTKYWGCYKTNPVSGSCKKENQVMMKDLFNY